ncbi:MAG: HAD-IIIC family phosphatase, partial [Candidatus Sericytochromatia bacterium]
GLPAVSLQWGPWQGAGMAAGQAKTLAQQGLSPLEADHGLDLLETLLGAEPAVLGVFRCDWARLSQRLPAESPRALWRGLLPSEDRAVARPFFEALCQAEGEARAQLLLDQLGRRLEGVLGLDLRPDSLQQRPLAELGFDSLMAVQLKNALESDLGQAVPMRLLLEGSSLKQLQTRLLAELDFSGTADPELSIPTAPPAPHYPLSSPQKRYYILEQLEGIKTSYNAAGLIEIRGQLDQARLERAFAELIGRHETLRTSFDFVQGKPVQRIEASSPFQLEHFDAEREKVPELVAGLVRPFDLSRAPLLRAALIRLEPEKHLLLLDLHHSITDAKSIGLMIRELASLYDGRPLPELPVSYKDFALWQQQSLQSQAFQAHRQYWLEQLTSPLPQLNMPRDYHRPQQQTFQGQSLSFSIDAESTSALKSLAAQAQTTLNTLLFAIYTLLLHYYSEQQDLIVGMIVEGRNHLALENLLGVFINFLPIRSRIAPEAPFTELLAQIRESMLAAFSHQDYQFDTLVSDLGLQADRSRNPLFDTMLLFHNELDGRPPESRELNFCDYEPISNNNARLDFLLDIFVRSDGSLKGVLEYNTHLFAPASMAGFVAHFQQLIALVLASPGTAQGGYDLFNPADRFRLDRARRLAECTREIPIEILINASFTAQPLEAPLSWWLRQFHLEPRIQFAPYNQVFQELLNPLSLSATHRGAQLLLLRCEDWLRDHSGSEAEAIALLEANFTTWIGLLQKRDPGQACFVGLFPVDPDRWSPTIFKTLESMYARLEQALTAMGISAVDFRNLEALYAPLPARFDAISDREGHQPFSEAMLALMAVSLARRLQAWKKPPFKLIVLDCDNTLWQGICGEDGPLGVSVPAPFRAFQQFLQRKRGEGMLLALCSRNHEADVREVFEKHPEMVLKPGDFVASRINWRPKSDNLRELAAELGLGLDSLIFLDDDHSNCLDVRANCPEVLTLHLPADPRDLPRFVNLLWAFDSHRITAEDQQRSQWYTLEQQRLSERQAYSLQDFLASLQLQLSFRRIAPAQFERVAQLTQRSNQFNLSTRRRSVSELRTLLQQPDTAGFAIEVADRFGAYGLVGVVIGQTREQAFWLDSFLLSCRVLGRGVETGILSCLKKFLQEQNLTVLEADFVPSGRNQPFGDFLVAAGWKQIELVTDPSRTQTWYLELASIPDFVSHLACHYLAPLPETETHTDQRQTAQATKVLQTVAATGPDQAWTPSWQSSLGDERQLLHRHHLLPLEYASAEAMLAATHSQSRGKSLYQRQFIEPAGETEVKLAAIFARILNLTGVSAEDSFFDLGGDSLKAVNLVAGIYQAFAADIPLRKVFEAPSVRSLAATLDSLGSFRHYRQNHQPWLLLNHPQPRKLFCFPPVVGYGFIYGTIARLIRSHAIYGFDFIEHRDRLEAYLDLILRLQPEGPYTLLGYSSGGNIAFELARLMEARSLSVSSLILLDAFKKDRVKNITSDEIEYFPEWALGKLKDPYLREFFQNLSQREEIDRKMQNFLVYHNQLINTGLIQADIHLIQSSQYSLYYKCSWADATTGRYHEYTGSGHHTEMLDSEHLAHNVGLIAKILE